MLALGMFDDEPKRDERESKPKQPAPRRPLYGLGQYVCWRCDPINMNGDGVIKEVRWSKEAIHYLVSGVWVAEEHVVATPAAAACNTPIMPFA
jgi:hypothetical protein